MDNILNKVAELAFQDELNKLAAVPNNRLPMKAISGSQPAAMAGTPSAATPMKSGIVVPAGKQQTATPAAAPNQYATAAKRFKGGSQFKDINQAILVRNKAARGSNEWNMAQNAINRAYGRGPQRQVQAMPAGTGARVLSKREPGSTMTVANFTIGDMARQNAQTTRPVTQQAPTQLASR